jgi:hypothetical protein
MVTSDQTDTRKGCVFCGRTPQTKEHVLPKWMRKLLPDHEPGTHRRKASGATGEHSYAGNPITQDG